MKNLLTKKAAYAKSASRFWENNSQTPNGCKDMAYQLIHGEIGSKLDVMLGGGYREFIPTEHGHGRSGRRTDRRNLIAEWIFSSRRNLFVPDRVGK